MTHLDPIVRVGRIRLIFFFILILFYYLWLKKNFYWKNRIVSEPSGSGRIRPVT